MNSKIKMKIIFLGRGEILALPSIFSYCEKLMLLFPVGEGFKCVFCVQSNTPGYSKE